jgi:hypothetical protein
MNKYKKSHPLANPDLDQSAGGALQDLPYPPPRPVPSKCKVHKEITKERLRKDQRKSVSTPYSSSAEAVKEGVGRTYGCSSPSAPISSASTLSRLSRTFHSDASLTASSAARGRVGLAFPGPWWIGRPKLAGFGEVTVFQQILPLPSLLLYYLPQSSALSSSGGSVR